MIYLISNQKRILSDYIQESTVEECLKYFKDKNIIGLDTETEGFDPFTKKLICIQLGDKDNQFVIDTSVVSVSNLQELLEDSSKTFVGHNLKFDLRFLLKERIVVKNTYDTYVSEQILYNGYENMKKSLDFVTDRYCGVFLDKSMRGNIHREGLSDRVIKYSADDVKYLLTIREKQLERAAYFDLLRSLELNNLFIPVIAYLEFSGFKLDVDKWKQKSLRDKEELKNKLTQLNNYIIENNITKYIDRQLDIWSTDKKTTINWNSPAQVVDLFSILNIDTSIMDKETGEVKHSVNSKILSKKIDENPIVSLYIEYRELLKKCSTYGENWFKFINPVTGRIHTKFQQWVTTGRMSSGGKDKDSNIDYPNAQNIPADEETRSCIVTEEENIFINADYDSQEVRVFANWCQDPALLKMFDDGYTDMHSYTAWHIFPEIKKKYPELTQETLKLVKKDFAHQRQISKTGNFAIQYGGTGYTVAENCNIPLQDGEEFYDNYFKAFTGVKKYFDYVYSFAKKNGYILYNNISREKYFIPKGLKDGKIKNYSYNYPIQGSSACITKYAGILYWRHLLEKDLVFKVKLAIICHDEFLVEVPKEIAKEESIVLKQCMEQAGDFYCKRIKLTATPVITPYWKH
jgi:DNA polymerase I-like protein with 3'-5' exonuclease and polymerase domains